LPQLLANRRHFYRAALDRPDTVNGVASVDAAFTHQGTWFIAKTLFKALKSRSWGKDVKSDSISTCHPG
jgi:hypothetical protein